MAEYAHPEVLVSTQWVADHLDDPSVRLLEVDYEPEGAYELGHIRTAPPVDWKRDIDDQLRRDILSKADFEALMSRVGATERLDVASRGAGSDPGQQQPESLDCVQRPGRITALWVSAGKP